MYNRYIPSADGTYRRQPVETPEMSECDKSSEIKRPLPFIPTLDSNDLLVLAVILIILQNSDEADRTSALITLTAFLFLS